MARTAEVEQLREALRELYAGMMLDRMPGQALVEWHQRYPWAGALVDDYDKET